MNRRKTKIRQSEVSTLSGDGQKTVVVSDGEKAP
jgi:hypothetical protein